MSFPPPSPKQANIIWLALTGIAIATLVLLVVALIWGAGQALQILSPVIWPLAIAGVIAYLLDPVVDKLETRGIPRTRAIIMVFACAVVLMLALLGSVVPQIVTETHDLAKRVPGYSQNIQSRVQKWINNPPPTLRRLLDRSSATTPTMSTNDTADIPQSTVQTTNVVSAASTNTVGGSTIEEDSANAFWSKVLGTDTVKSAADWFAKMAPKAASWAGEQISRVASFFGLLAGLALVPVYAFYFLLEKRGIETHWTDYLPVKKSGFKNELIFIIKSINDHLISFFRGQVLVAICDGICYTIGFLIIGLPYAVLLGAVAIVLTMIPFLGAIATCAAALVIAFVQFGDWQHPLLVLAVFAVVQSLEGFVIQPKIMGDRTGLHPLTIIIAVMVGTSVLGGILGGILAIPMTAAGKVLMLRYVWKQREA
ncbi:MAG: AI-2E family transporter [Verrucomicrobia bacterium]|nr:AI-2E family transporter [Verrucomicrobiota bacterium]